MKRHAVLLAAAVTCYAAAPATAQIGTVLFQENFNGLTLGPSVNERQATANVTRVATDAASTPYPNAFTHTPPSGWVVDNNYNNFGFTDLDNPGYFYGFIVGNTGMPNQGSPTDGVDEWEGWSFANKTFWAGVDDQQRSAFANSSGTIAVVDSDEYDDLGTGRGGGYYNSGLTTAPINVSAFNNGSTALNFAFDSSWRDESFDDAHTLNPNLGGASVNNQTVMIWASFDGNAPELVDLWHSDPNDSLDFKDDATNERLSYQIAVPQNAQSMKLTFGYMNAGNDWWWAIDNLSLAQGANPAFWTENFEALTLGPSVNERLGVTKVTAVNTDPATVPRPNSFTHTTPAGWSIDNSGISPTAVGDNNVGVFEWEGWSFTTRDFSVFASQTAIDNFTKGTGNIAIADSDEFDDLSGGAGVTRPMSTVLRTPSLNVAGLAANSLKLQFDSAWLPEGVQAASITVDYGSGEVEVLRWESDVSLPGYHGDNLDETVLVDLNNPAGASSAVVRFKYLDGSNNWFWAIDNIKIGVEASGNADFDSDGDVDGADFLAWQRGKGVGTTRAQGNADGDGDVDAADLAIWKGQFGQTGLATAASAAVPEPTAWALSLLVLSAITALGRRAA
ncbi:MAG: hypothetical protein IT424_10850 [Pirellulales bacterium]|nr:hypothetical protein [Pirellulales bacterium]